MVRKIGILTSGGDSPGMNSALKAVAKAAISYNIEPYFIFNGYSGIINKNIKSAKEFGYDTIGSLGGTVIGSTRFVEFRELEVQKKAKEILDELGIESLVVIGGDGTYKGGYKLHKLGVKVIGLPGTIDNDIQFTDYTIGFDTALNTIVESIDKLRDTAASHKRVFLVEVMGRHCQDLALYSGIATGSEIIITNTFRPSDEEIVEIVKQQFAKGKSNVIINVSEYVIDDLKALAKYIESSTGFVTKHVELAHLQRGGRPSAFERILAAQMGVYAVELIVNGESGFAVGHLNGKIEKVPLKEVFTTKNANSSFLVEKYNKINQT
ncbi:6-phosphofructokinase [Mesomycoplasma conjunctivae]|uniref:ATP-dependent 6-phosphofructokinase n=1 Tax=Mesomycoplasma conjunctivae (strain ATCC 25834 / NCTC 10147 / HRC/581) TaxID=572263 RepID=C5J703_MESCH|nr:6-phosphofructokinase [Mesomycoplasma conjunctivae]CAT05266.1 6-phosphofructokinase [Mesomycoplasma conjunctivae]VEU66496.1 6-phosphofructokinase [Mesomycoplasma conjunctivae]